MSYSSCPMSAQSNQENDIRYVPKAWHQAVFKQYARRAAVAFIFINMVSWLIVKYQYPAWIPYFIWVVCCTGLIAVIGLFRGYFRAIRRTISDKDQPAIPVYGMMAMLVDVLCRPKMLLREMDVERQRTLGDIYLMFAGLRPAIVVTNSAFAEVISKQYDLFEKSDPRDLNMPFFYEWVGDNNVVLANGAQWRALRALIHDAVNEVERFTPIFDQKAKRLVAQLQSACFDKNPPRLN